MPSGALGGAWRCVRRSNFSIHTWSSILPDAARVKDFRWTCVDGVLPSRRWRASGAGRVGGGGLAWFEAMPSKRRRRREAPVTSRHRAEGINDTVPNRLDHVGSGRPREQVLQVKVNARDLELPHVK